MKRGKLLITSVVLTILLLAGGTAFVFSTQKADVEQQETQPSPTVEFKKPTVSEILELVNEERAKEGVSPLAIDERLNQSAQRKADDMVANHYYDHVSPVDGKHGYQYMEDLGVHCTAGGENLNKVTGTSRTSRAIVNSWIGSETHHKAMVDSRISITGIAVSQNDDGDILVVEHFCN